jgi:hypothetical protein
MTGAAHRLILTLTDTLLRERDMLLAGEFEALATSATAREALTARLETLDGAALSGETRAVQRMREAAARNVELLRAALDGAAAGRRRAVDIVEARGKLASYDAKGAPVERSAVAAEGRRA